MDTRVSGSTVKNHISLKTGFGYNGTRRSSFRSWFQACHRVLPPTFLLQHQWHLQDRRLIILHLPQARLLHQTQLCQAKVNGKNGETRTTPKYRNDCKNLEKILWMIEFLAETHTPVLLVNRLQSLCLREVRIWVSTVFKLISLKTEIARSARGRKLQGPRAEDAMAEPYLVQKILVNWLQPITKFSVKVVNLETIIDMQSWCRTWPPNGSSRIRAKRKLLRKHKGACKSSWSRIGSLKSFTLTIPWNLAKLVKIFPGIIARPHHTDRKLMGLLSRAVRKVKEGTSAVLLQSGLNENWWADSMECYTYLRNVTDLLSDGKTPYERRFGEPFKGPIIPFGTLVEYYTISA